MRDMWKSTPFGKDSPSPWTFIYPHRNPRKLPSGYAPNEAEARQYKGLVLTPIYDPVGGFVMTTWWELRHAVSTDMVFFIKADGDELAEFYAQRVADMANWEHMRAVPAWETPPHSQQMIDFLASTKDVFHWPNYEALFPDLQDPDLDDYVPYGAKW